MPSAPTYKAQIASGNVGNGPVFSPDFSGGSWGNNCVFEVAGKHYALIPSATTGSGAAPVTYQCYRSTDGGATWGAWGVASSTLDGDVESSVWQDGSTLWIGRSGVQSPTNTTLTLIPFFTATGSWGGAVTTDLTGKTIEGPFNVRVRPDGTHLLVLSVTVGSPDGAGPIGQPAVLPFDGSSTFGTLLPVGTDTGDTNYLLSVAMASDGTLYVLFQDHGYTNYWVATVSPAGSVSSSTLLDTGSAIGLTYFGFGDIGYGDVDGSGKVYIPVCLASGPQNSAFGILHWNGSIWQFTGALDTTAVTSTNAVWADPLLVVQGSNLLAIYQVGDNTGPASGGQLRFGWAPISGFTTAGNWTWSTFYDYGSPSPTVSGLTTPYAYAGNHGHDQAISLDASGNLWYLVTLLTGANAATAAIVFLASGGAPGPAARYYGL